MPARPRMPAVRTSAPSARRFRDSGNWAVTSGAGACVTCLARRYRNLTLTRRRSAMVDVRWPGSSRSPVRHASEGRPDAAGAPGRCVGPIAECPDGARLSGAPCISSTAAPHRPGRRPSPPSSPAPSAPRALEQVRDPVGGRHVLTVHVFGSTVGDVLDKQDITLGPHDVVVPRPSAPDRRRREDRRPLRPPADRHRRRRKTGLLDHRDTVAAALPSWASAPTRPSCRSRARRPSAGRPGPRRHHAQGRLGQRGRQDASPRSTAPTVKAVLAELRVTVGAAGPGPAGPDHRVGKPGVDDHASPGVSRGPSRSPQTVPFASRTTAGRRPVPRPDRKVTAGHPGARVVTLPSRPGSTASVESRKATAATVTATPVDPGRRRGHQGRGPAPEPAPAAALPARPAAPSGAGLNLADAAMWDRIAQCESGGNWHINTGNGYYGGLQFAPPPGWPTAAATSPRAPTSPRREQQITVAEPLLRRGRASASGAARTRPDATVTTPPHSTAPDPRGRGALSPCRLGCRHDDELAAQRPTTGAPRSRADPRARRAAWACGRPSSGARTSSSTPTPCARIVRLAGVEPGRRRRRGRARAWAR